MIIIYAVGANYILLHSSPLKICYAYAGEGDADGGGGGGGATITEGSVASRQNVGDGGCLII